MTMAGRSSNAAGNAAGRYNLRPQGFRGQVGQGGIRGAAALADSPLLGRLLEEWSHVFDAKVLPLLDPVTRALLGRVGQACRDAVLRCPKLPCAGQTVGVELELRSFVGSVKLLAWAKDNGCSWDFRTCRRAASEGQLEVLQWAREHDCPWDACTCSYAASYGHLEVLQWAREQGCQCWWEWQICNDAAGGGHLAVLQWAREQGCPWDRTFVFAAVSGNLAVLEWLHKQDCPWDEGTCAPLSVGTWRC